MGGDSVSRTPGSSPFSGEHGRAEHCARNTRTIHCVVAPNCCDGEQAGTGSVAWETLLAEQRYPGLVTVAHSGKFSGDFVPCSNGHAVAGVEFGQKGFHSHIRIVRPHFWGLGTLWRAYYGRVVKWTIQKTTPSGAATRPRQPHWRRFGRHRSAVKRNKRCIFEGSWQQQQRSP